MATLNRFDVPAAEQQELLGMLGPMKVDIVEVDGPETGTPLRRSTSPPLRSPHPDVTACRRSGTFPQTWRRRIPVFAGIAIFVPAAWFVPSCDT